MGCRESNDLGIGLIAFQNLQRSVNIILPNANTEADIHVIDAVHLVVWNAALPLNDLEDWLRLWETVDFITEFIVKPQEIQEPVTGHVDESPYINSTTKKRNDLFRVD